MRLWKSLGMVSAAALLAAAVSLPASAELANASLKDKSGKPIGDIDLMQTQAGVLLKITVKGIEPGEHLANQLLDRDVEAAIGMSAQPPDPDLGTRYRFAVLIEHVSGRTLVLCKESRGGERDRRHEYGAGSEHGNAQRSTGPAAPRVLAPTWLSHF